MSCRGICGIVVWCVAAVAGAQTLALHPENQHYASFRGKPTLLVTSGEHYGAVLNLDFDYVQYLHTLSADERRVDIDWQETAGEAFAVRLAVTGEDRRGLYADIMEAVSQTGTNIRGADLHTKDGSVFGTIFVEVDNLPHLGKVMKAVRKVKGVTDIERRESPGN